MTEKQNTPTLKKTITPPNAILKGGELNNTTFFTTQESVRVLDPSSRFEIGHYLLTGLHEGALKVYQFHAITTEELLKS